ncbi:MAG TPA: hypothetical protein VMH82_05795 [Myxococcota bacterium]|nr:hypothetical protein [Myxococcota bacterium]
MSRSLRQLAVGLAPALLLAAPRAATACAVCFGGQSDLSRKAFFGTTMLLTLLPFVLIGGLIWWVRRRARQLEEEARREDREAAALEVSRASSSR